MQWNDLVSSLINGEDLTREEAYWLMDRVMSGELGEVRLASALTALAVKGLSVDETYGFADAMRDHAIRPQLPEDSLDIVGTGGDGFKTVNISTMAAVLLAACDTPVVKHGNRATTSASGSADVLEALGVNLDLNHDEVSHAFDSVGIAFLFANKVHPSMRFASPVRRELAFPTAFNVLGPLTNPARPRAAAIGSAKARNAELMAGVLAARSVSALVFRGLNSGLDELTTTDVNEIWHVHDGQIEHIEIDAVSDLGLAPSTIDDLRGGVAAENAAIAREVFAGRGSQAVSEAVALNAAAGLVAFGKHEALGTPDGDLVERLKAALEVTRTALAEGKAQQLFNRWVEVTARYRLASNR